MNESLNIERVNGFKNLYLTMSLQFEDNLVIFCNEIRIDWPFFSLGTFSIWLVNDGKKRRHIELKYFCKCLLCEISLFDERFCTHFHPLLFWKEARIWHSEHNHAVDMAKERKKTRDKSFPSASSNTVFYDDSLLIIKFLIT